MTFSRFNDVDRLVAGYGEKVMLCNGFHRRLQTVVEHAQAVMIEISARWQEFILRRYWLASLSDFG